MDLSKADFDNFYKQISDELRKEYFLVSKAKAATMVGGFITACAFLLGGTYLAAYQTIHSSETKAVTERIKAMEEQCELDFKKVHAVASDPNMTPDLSAKLRNLDYVCRRHVEIYRDQNFHPQGFPRPGIPPTKEELNTLVDITLGKSSSPK